LITKRSKAIGSYALKLCLFVMGAIWISNWSTEKTCSSGQQTNWST